MTNEQRTEVLVLAACLIEEPESTKAVLRRVRPEHFSLDSHRRIFQAIQGLSEPNIFFLLEALGNEVPSCGGAAYITDLTSGIPKRLGSTVHEYISRLLEQWRVREVKRISAWMEDSDGDSSEIIRCAQQQLSSLEDQKSEDNATSVFADFPSFVTDESAKMDWLLAPIIERGANGFIAADPKTGKSFCAADMVLSLATGSSWLDFSCPRPVRVGLVSREDNPALTSWRLRNLFNARQFNPVQLRYLSENLYINTRSQTPSFMLDNDCEMQDLIAALRERKIEFVLLDVLNVLHRADENDNTQMADVLRKAKKIQEKTGASLGIIHHFSKSETAKRITQRLRGASAIAGFAEWIIGLTMADEEAQVRRVEFELKAAAPPDPIYFSIAPDGNGIKLSRVAMQAQQSSSKRQSKGVN